jgi:hypothetical protein
MFNRLNAPQWVPLWRKQRETWGWSLRGGGGVPWTPVPVSMFTCYITYIVPTLRHVTNSIQLSPSWETSSCSATEACPKIVWNPKVHCRVHKSPPLFSMLSEIKPNITACSLYWYYAFVNWKWSIKENRRESGIGICWANRKARTKQVKEKKKIAKELWGS